MYEDERHSEFEAPVARAAAESGAVQAGGDLGRYISGLGAAAMLVGIAIAIHMWMPPGPERTTLIMCVAGVGAWVLAAFTLHLGSERATLLTILFPTVIFLAVLIVVLALAQRDFPEGYERIEPPATAAAHEEP